MTEEKVVPFKVVERKATASANDLAKEVFERNKDINFSHVIVVGWIEQPDGSETFRFDTNATREDAIAIAQLASYNWAKDCFDE